MSREGRCERLDLEPDRSRGRRRLDGRRSARGAPSRRRARRGGRSSAIDRPEPFHESPRARDQHDRAVEALDEPRGDDPDHSLVPVLARRARSRGAGARARAARRRARSPRGGSGPRSPAARGSAPRAPRRARLRPCGVLGEDELERDVRPAESPGRVDPRREPESDRRRRPRPRDRRARSASAPAGRVVACRRARAARPPRARDSRPRAGRRRRSVASATRSRWRRRAGCSGAEEGLAELVARRPSRRAPETGTTTGGSRRRGQSGSASPGRWWSVTTTSRPSALRLGDLVDGGDPAVDGDDEPDAVVGQPLERVARDAVALLETAREMPGRRRLRARAGARTARAVAQIPSTS